MRRQLLLTAALITTLGAIAWVVGVHDKQQAAQHETDHALQQLEAPWQPLDAWMANPATYVQDKITAMTALAARNAQTPAAGSPEAQLPPCGVVLRVNGTITLPSRCRPVTAAELPSAKAAYTGLAGFARFTGDAATDIANLSALQAMFDQSKINEVRKGAAEGGLQLAPSAPMPVAPPPAGVPTPEQMATYNDTLNLWIFGIFVGATILWLAITITQSVRWRRAQRGLGYGLTVRNTDLLALEYDPPPTGRYRRLGH